MCSDPRLGRSVSPITEMTVEVALDAFYPNGCWRAWWRTERLVRERMRRTLEAAWTDIAVARETRIAQDQITAHIEAAVDSVSNA